jgi:hypothetical protein
VYQPSEEVATLQARPPPLPRFRRDP